MTPSTHYRDKNTSAYAKDIKYGTWMFEDLSHKRAKVSREARDGDFICGGENWRKNSLRKIPKREAERGGNFASPFFFSNSVITPGSNSLSFSLFLFSFLVAIS